MSKGARARLVAMVVALCLLAVLGRPAMQGTGGADSGKGTPGAAIAESAVGGSPSASGKTRSLSALTKSSALVTSSGVRVRAQQLLSASEQPISELFREDVARTEPNAESRIAAKTGPLLEIAAAMTPAQVDALAKGGVERRPIELRFSEGSDEGAVRLECNGQVLELEPIALEDGKTIEVHVGLSKRGASHSQAISIWSGAALMLGLTNAESESVVVAIELEALEKLAVQGQP